MTVADILISTGAILSAGVFIGLVCFWIIAVLHNRPIVMGTIAFLALRVFMFVVFYVDASMKGLLK